LSYIIVLSLNRGVYSERINVGEKLHKVHPQAVVAGSILRTVVEKREPGRYAILRRITGLVFRPFPYLCVLQC